MDWLTKFIYIVKNSVVGGNFITLTPSNVSGKKSVFNGSRKSECSNEIKMSNDISDEQITRSNYITSVKNPDHKVKSGENISKIADKYGIEARTLMAANGLNEKSVLKLGQTLKIPPTRKPKNVRNLNDVAKAMGVSPDFIKKLKSVEDSAHLPANKFHNTPYKDKGGVETIGIGHVVKPGEPRKLTDAQVCELCAKDLLKMEDNLSALLGGKKNYEKLPQGLKEALLDMVFNKGTEIIEKTPGLLYCLKSGKYEAAVNKFTDIRTATGARAERSGLAKRRLFDISLAMKMYNGKIPQSNINTAQEVYNRGVALLRAECKKDGKNFQNIIAGYNKDILSYLGNKIKLVTK